MEVIIGGDIKVIGFQIKLERERNFDIAYDDDYDSDDYGDGNLIADVYNINDDDGISNVE